MKKRKLLLFLVAVGLMAGNAQANMLANPGYEDGVYDAKNVPDGWTQSYASYTSAWTWHSGTGAHSGTKYVQTQPWPGYTSNVYMSQPVTGVTAGEDYQFSIWAKNADAGLTNSERFWIQWYNTSSVMTSSAVGFMSSHGVFIDVTSTDWTQLDFGSFTAPEGTVAGRFWIGVDGTNPGSTYVDDASMVPEPVTIGLLGLGGIALLRRRKA